MRSPLIALVSVLAAGALLCSGSSAASSSSGDCQLTSEWTALATPEAALVYGAGTIGTQSVAVSWTAPTVLYAAAFDTGLYRSVDCGSSWEVLPRPREVDEARGVGLLKVVAIDQAGRLYVAGQGHTLVVSPDTGATWLRTRALDPLNPYPDTGQPRRVGIVARDLTTSPAQPGLAYASVTQSVDIRPLALGAVRSTDGGITWEVRSHATPRGLAAGPEPNTVFVVGGPGVYVSNDALASIESPLKEFDSVPIAVAITADGSRLWVATRGRGLYRSPDRGLSWEQLPPPPFGDEIQRLATDPKDAGLLFVVTEGGEIWAHREAVAPEPGSPLPPG